MQRYDVAQGPAMIRSTLTAVMLLLAGAVAAHAQSSEHRPPTKTGHRGPITILCLRTRTMCHHSTRTSRTSEGPEETSVILPGLAAIVIGTGSTERIITAGVEDTDHAAANPPTPPPRSARTLRFLPPSTTCRGSLNPCEYRGHREG
jgi:hypothetical protein